ncbi:MAG: DUF4407 domain-containing protein [Gloeobacteraceae cyanobacterium ES-bin-316]|nr:DUF4407 domain-containing protein [Ferruginibacter sp.]
MTEKNIALSQRESDAPSSFTIFLWWLSTAEKELLRDAVVDRNRYKIVGMTVLATWAFATLAWTYFFTTVTANYWLAIPLGFFMGFIILTIDRALIKGISKFNKNRLLPLVFRGLLAVTIGIFMAQPALLYMFKKEITLQTSLDNEKKQLFKKQALDSLYKNRKNELLLRKEGFKKENNEKYGDVSTARNNFLAETDGSGGTGKVGIKDIAIAKRNEYQKLDAEYQLLLSANQLKIAAADDELTSIEAKIKKEEDAFRNYFNDGFLTQIEALNNLIKDNSALKYRYYLLVIILLLIELMPVIAKTLLPAGTYDENVMLREDMEKEIAHSNIRKEQELKEMYNTLAQQSDTEAITAFFSLTKDDRTEKMKAFSKRWKEQNHQTFDGLWEKMKKEILTKQEN